MTSFLRRCLTACALFASAVLPAQAQAPAWPSKPVRLIVAFPPGGIVDNVARQIQPRLEAALGQTVIVENRGGAGGTVGSMEVARAAPDGYTLLMVFDSYATYPLVYPKLGFDVAKDLLPVTQIASNALVLVVNPQVPAKDFKGFVTLLKSQPGRYNYASVGPGSSNHLTAEYFKAETGTFRPAHPLPRRRPGTTGSGGRAGRDDVPVSRAGAAACQGRQVARTGADRRRARQCLCRHADRRRRRLRGFKVNSWVGMLAPAGTPRPVVDRLQTEIRKIVTDPAFAARLQEQGLTGIANTPEQFAAVLKLEQDKWTRLVRERQLSLE